MQIIIPSIGQVDGLGQRLIGTVAAEVNAGSRQIRLHSVRYPVHVLLFVPLSDVGIKFLQGRAQKHTGHNASPPYPFIPEGVRFW